MAKTLCDSSVFLTVTKHICYIFYKQYNYIVKKVCKHTLQLTTQLCLFLGLSVVYILPQ